VQRVEEVVYGGVVSASRREPFSYEDPADNGEMRPGGGIFKPERNSRAQEVAMTFPWQEIHANRD
jgi:hypothetical protein